MKKVLFILLAASVVMFASCKNRNASKNAGASSDENVVVEYVEDAVPPMPEEMKANLDNLIASVKQAQPVFPSFKKNCSKVTLTDKEKKVKPSYLIKADAVNGLVTLSQKYRLLSMIAMDKVVAEKYDMNVEDYKAAIAKLLVEINDPSLKSFYEKAEQGETPSETSNEFIAAAYSSGRASLYWEGVAASMVENLYIATRGNGKYLASLTDQDVQDITFNFVCLYENIKALLPYYPEMAGLNNLLGPLYVINAISVKQFAEQLESVKSDIESIRAEFLK